MQNCEVGVFQNSPFVFSGLYPEIASLKDDRVEQSQKSCHYCSEQSTVKFFHFHYINADASAKTETYGSTSNNYINLLKL